MKELFAAFLKENIRSICLYLGFAGIYFIIFELYKVPADAVSYAFLLAGACLLMYGILEFTRFVRRRRQLLEAEAEALAEFASLPVPAGLIEEDYQRILKMVCEEKMELESQGRISAQEMADYYGMWVHQIKTPIAALSVLLQEQEAEEDEQGRQLFGSMRAELFKIEQYVDMVLAYLRVSSMSSDLRIEMYTLDDIIRQAVHKYSSMFVLQKIRLAYEPTGKRILTDEKWLVFVLGQILSNALKYTEKGSISIYMDGKFLVVEDTGIGIAAEDLPRVFERGFTGYNGRSDKKSTGIGLYLCKSAMDKLGQEIRLESEPGKGTKVFLGVCRPKLRME